MRKTAARILTAVLLTSGFFQDVACYASAPTQTLQLKTQSGWQVQAQLTYPKDPQQSVPVVIFAHGGGCGDVDCTVGPNSFPFWRKLEQWFLKNGFAVIRFYRGPTKSVRDDIELLLSAYHQARSLKYIIAEKVGFFGHSEGTWQSVLAADELTRKGNPVGFLILNGSFMVGLAQHSEAQLREIFLPVKNHFVDRVLSQIEIRELRSYLESWYVPEPLICLLEKREISLKEVDAVQSEVLKIIRDFIDHDAKLASWKSLRPVREILPQLDTFPIIVNEGLLDQETPYSEVASYIIGHPQENLILNTLPGLNHYFADVQIRNGLPQKDYDPMSRKYLSKLKRSLEEIGLVGLPRSDRHSK